MSNYKIASDDLEGEDASASDHTLGSPHNGHLDEEKPSRADGGESGGHSPQRLVGFWDKGLSKTRLKVFGLWARTSKTTILPIFTGSGMLMTIKQ